MNPEEHLRRIKAMVDEQAQDEALWFRPVHATEAYLQQSLRRLHAVIEGDERMLALFRETKTH